MLLATILSVYSFFCPEFWQHFDTISDDDDDDDDDDDGGGGGGGGNDDGDANDDLQRFNILPVSIRRLRAEGLQVLERARPRTRPASLRVNHGGVAIAAALGVCSVKRPIFFRHRGFCAIFYPVGCLWVLFLFFHKYDYAESW